MSSAKYRKNKALRQLKEKLDSIGTPAYTAQMNSSHGNEEKKTH